MATSTSSREAGSSASSPLLSPSSGTPLFPSGTGSSGSVSSVPTSLFAAPSPTFTTSEQSTTPNTMIIAIAIIVPVVVFILLATIIFISYRRYHADSSGVDISSGPDWNWLAFQHTPLPKQKGRLFPMDAEADESGMSKMTSETMLPSVVLFPSTIDQHHQYAYDVPSPPPPVANRTQRISEVIDEKAEQERERARIASEIGVHEVERMPSFWRGAPSM